MTDLEKPKTTRKKKPPTQTAGVNGIDAHGSMGAAPIEKPFQQYVDWHKLMGLPAFQMFVLEASTHQVGDLATQWVRERRAALGDDLVYRQYADWHKLKGLWENESPTGQLTTKNK